MTDAEYRAYELSKAYPTNGETVHIKVRSMAGESRWFALTPELFATLFHALTAEPEITPTLGQLRETACTCPAHLTESEPTA
jgi:hypothetical protein